MRHDPMGTHRRGRGVFRALLSLTLLLCCVCSPGVWAAGEEEDYIRLKIDGYDADSVSYRVESNCDYPGALAITTTYSGGQMSQTKLETFDLVSQTDHQGSQSFTKPFDSFNVILVDGTTFRPICREGKLHQVSFYDHEGKLIATRAAGTGQSADPPQAPLREGYVFVGWSDSYDDVTGDRSLTARYVEEDSLNIFALTGTEGAPGEEVTLSVHLTGTVLTCGYDMRLVYDGDALEYVSHNVKSSMEVLANHVPAKNAIRFNFASRKDHTVAGGIMDVTFRIKDSGRASAPVRLEAISVICLDPADDDQLKKVGYTACEGVVVIR